MEGAVSEATIHAVGIDPRREGSEPVVFAELFGNDRPVTLEIGSGKGRFLLQAALAEPGRNLLGIEKSLHYFRVIVDRVRRAKLSNVRVINHDAGFVVGRMIASASVDEIHIYFPDPWPRPRERKRRMIREEVLRDLERILVAGGVGFYVTDHREYFEKSLPLFEAIFETAAGEVVAGSPARTNYEAKYQEEGRPIYQVMFRKRMMDER